MTHKTGYASTAQSRVTKLTATFVLLSLIEAPRRDWATTAWAAAWLIGTGCEDEAGSLGTIRDWIGMDELGNCEGSDGLVNFLVKDS